MPVVIDEVEVEAAERGVGSPRGPEQPAAPRPRPLTAAQLRAMSRREAQRAARLEAD